MEHNPAVAAGKYETLFEEELMEDEVAENAEMEMEEEIEDDEEEGEEGDYSVHQNWTESDKGFIREKNWPRALQTYKDYNDNKMHKIFKPQQITNNEDQTGHLFGMVDNQSEENRIVNGYEAGVKYLIQFHQI